MRRNKIIYCGNCGKRGHVYKECYMPIISLGLICMKFDNINIGNIIKKNRIDKWIFNKFIINNLLLNEKVRNYVNNNMKFLLVRRKNTISFIEFIRGNYPLDDYNYIKNTFQNMTKEEFKLVQTQTIDQLWQYLWSGKDDNHKKEYEITTEKYYKLKKGIEINGKIYDLEYIFKNVKSNWDETEWEFPKGRRNIKESDIDCANREFMEETDFKLGEYQILDAKPIDEIFTASNSTRYQHRYYLAQIETDKQPELNDDNIHQQIEIGDIRWFSFSEAMDKIRDYNIERKEVLRRVYNFIYYHIYNDIKKKIYENN